jgi:serine/threonine-protein kinase RsbW
MRQRHARRKSQAFASGWCLRLTHLGIPALRPQSLVLLERGGTHRRRGACVSLSDGQPGQVNGLALHLPAEPDQVPVARRAVAEFCERVGMPAPLIDDVKLVVTEACTNVVLHAYEGAADRGPMLVELWHRASRLVVRVSDAGAGMMPRMDRGAPGLGLGLRLIAVLAAEMRVTTNREEGTAVWMRFDLK